MTAGVEETIVRAEAALEVRRPEEARRLLDPLAAADPGNATVLVLLAWTWHQLGHVAQVQALTRRAAAAAPDDVSVLVRCADLARQSRDLPAARAWAERAVAIAPDSMAALNVLSLVLTQVGAGREAVVYSRRALSHEPLDPDLLVAHGVALDVDGRPGDATAQYVQALGADPQHVHALNNLAALRLQCGDLDRAASLLTRALVYDPRLSEARANIDVVAGLARSVLISRLGLVMALACGLAYAQVPGAWLLAVIGGVWAGVGLWRLPAPVRGRLGRDIDWRDIAVLVLILVTAPVAFGGDPSGSALPFIAWIVIFGVAVIGRLVWRRVAVAIRLRRLGVRLRGV